MLCKLPTYDIIFHSHVELRSWCKFLWSRDEDRYDVDIFRCSCLCSLIPPPSDMRLRGKELLEFAHEHLIFIVSSIILRSEMPYRVSECRLATKPSLSHSRVTPLRSA